MSCHASINECPLCGANGCAFYHQDKRRDYHQCRCCELVFVAPQYFLEPEREKAEYDLHINSPADPAYRDFLSRLSVPLLQRLPPAQRGLDFGCGPGPTLSLMLEQAGHAVTLYDPFYQPQRDVLNGPYDFITATEVVEHLHQPGVELEKLWAMLTPGGYLGLMTKLVRDPDAFSGWHYKNDPTHVCFFSEPTWRWWARQHQATLEILGADVILLQRSS